MSPPTTPPVLIVGAGPTGLVLALALTKLSIPLRIIDRAPTPGLTSRAVVIHARTLEFYRQLGLATTVVAAGTKVPRTHIRSNGTVRGVLPFGDAGLGFSRYPFVLSWPQDEHEAVLAEELRKEGVRVEREVEVVGCRETQGQGQGQGQGVEVTMRKKDGAVERVVVGYVAGCDGAHSAIRGLSGIPMVGGTYPQRFFVADVDATGEALTQPGINICLSGYRFCVVVPLTRPGGARLLGFVPEELNEKENVGFEDIREVVEKNTGVRVSEVGWMSTYRVHCRVAERFRQGRVFLLGDAAHLHSPVGGQGMNTGLGDAVNLAWKLAAVVKAEAGEELLDTYEEERIGFAKTLVKTTDRFFVLLTHRGWLGWFLRGCIVPYVLPFVWSFDAAQKMIFRKLSQIEIQYRRSKLSGGSGERVAGTVKAGDRLPWVEMGEGDNYEVLCSMKWQVHVYEAVADEVMKELWSKNLSVHAFPWSKPMEAAGLTRDVLYLVRPDGHVGTICGKDEARTLIKYLNRWTIA